MAKKTTPTVAPEPLKLAPAPTNLRPGEQLPGQIVVQLMVNGFVVGGVVGDRQSSPRVIEETGEVQRKIVWAYVEDLILSARPQGPVAV